MGTEQATTLEQVLVKGQDSEEEVSEKEITEVADEGTTEPEAEQPEGDTITFTPEQEAEIEKRAQSRRDKDLNPYREKREADTALIRSQQARIKELESEGKVKKLDKSIEAILAGDEEDGTEPDKIEERRKGLAEIKAAIKDYKGKAADIDETAKMLSSLTEKIASEKAIAGFHLDDPNPTVRVKNYAEFINGTINVYEYNQNFLKAVEGFLPKGDELRKQIEDIVEGMSEFTDEKGRALYLKDKLRGVKVTPRKKPPAPSDISGGDSLAGLPREERLIRAMSKMDKGK